MPGTRTLSVPRSRVRTENAPAAIGPYSQAILVGDTLYVSGQVALDPATGHLVEGGVEAETERAIENLGAILRAEGMDYRNVVRCSVYLADMNDYGQVNEIYARYFSDMPPAREAFQVAALPRNARIEISCIAVR